MAFRTSCNNRYLLPVIVAVATLTVLSVIQTRGGTPLLLAERLFSGGGWFQVVLLAGYGFYITGKIEQPELSALWRRRIWILFSLIFFSQLLLGLTVDSLFLMTGKLHVPVPALLVAGPVYRGEAGFMTILFLSTIIITGPSWCSFLCYFGAFDATAAAFRGRPTAIKHLWYKKGSVLFITIVIAIALRIAGVSPVVTTLTAISAGVAGVAIMLIWSRRRGMMVHCLTWCPAGTVVNILRHVNPFSLTISKSCDGCMRCSAVCHYDALGSSDIERGKPGLTCTLCGDCVAVCGERSIGYKLFSLSPEKSRKVFLAIVLTVHTLFLGLARI